MVQTGKVQAICVSTEKGTQKQRVPYAVFVKDWGIENDAHAGTWHRQISLLSYDRIQDFRKKGAEVKDGDFGENLVVDGLDFSSLPVGTRFTIGKEVLLEMTQIGKECHHGCDIFHLMGECIMPTQGVFAKVLQGGLVREGDLVVQL